MTPEREDLCERHELQAVEGIGAKTADSIRWAIGETIEPYGDQVVFSV